MRSWAAAGLALLAGILAPALLAADGRGSTPPTLRLVVEKTDLVYTDRERYVGYGRDEPRFLNVLDTRRRRSFRVRLPPGCRPPPRLPWASGRTLLWCEDSAHYPERESGVLDLATGRSFIVPNEFDVEGHRRTYVYSGIGRYWLSHLAGPCAPTTPGSCDLYYNFHTGEHRVIHRGTFDYTYYDLDDPLLRRVRVCAPHTRRGGQVPFYGRYERPYVLFPSRGLWTLRRCGMREELLRFGGMRPSLSAGLVSWQLDDRINAYEIKAKRRYRWRIPASRRRSRRYGEGFHTRQSVFVVPWLSLCPDSVCIQGEATSIRIYEARLR